TEDPRKTGGSRDDAAECRVDVTSVAVRLAAQGAYADPGGHPYLLIGLEPAKVGGLESGEPSDLAPLVADDDAREHRSRARQSADDARADVGVHRDLVVAEADRLGEGVIPDPGDLRGGGPAVDRLLEHLHIMVGTVVEDEELDGKPRAGGRRHLHRRHQEA